ncbi:unnamed protein product [Trypanosoma congolense IL3000]|uniref:WGS project CAEQ00000000 data, annotated contig 359 n=1 Tax=Trypanosoma congolense (strain IL3000) TaxID=1068625 RepID=F9WF80_TRYCI|nr:unnamed protein product [Trypanosoma congolense IL3000]
MPSNSLESSGTGTGIFFTPSKGNIFLQMTPCAESNENESNGTTLKDSLHSGSWGQSSQVPLYVLPVTEDKWLSHIPSVVERRTSRRSSSQLGRAPASSFLNSYTKSSLSSYPPFVAGQGRVGGPASCKTCGAPQYLPAAGPEIPRTEIQTATTDQPSSPASPLQTTIPRLFSNPTPQGFHQRVMEAQKRQMNKLLHNRQPETGGKW